MTYRSNIDPNAMDLVASDFHIPENYYDFNLNLNLNYIDPTTSLNTSNYNLDIFTVPHNNDNGSSDLAVDDADISDIDEFVEEYLVEANISMQAPQEDLTNDVWNYPSTHEHSGPVVTPGELWESGVFLSSVDEWNGDWVTLMNMQSQTDSPSAEAYKDLQPSRSQTATPPWSPSKAPAIGEAPNLPVVGSSSQLEGAATRSQQVSSPLEDVSDDPPPTMNPAPLRSPSRPRRASPRAVGRNSRQAAEEHAARQAAAGVPIVANNGHYASRVPLHLIQRIRLPPTTTDTLCVPNFGDSYICIQLASENIPPPSQRSKPCAHNVQGGIGVNGSNDTCKSCIEESSNRVPSNAQSAGGQSQNAVSTPRARSPPRLKRFFDYTGVPVRQVKYRTNHLNTASNPSVANFEEYEEFSERYSDSLCNIHRIRYQRFSLDHLESLHEDVIYERNNGYCETDPYQQEFTRIELVCGTTTPKIETRSALCGFCEHIHFYELKNSSYSQHMSHVHGIYTNNFLTPNPVMIGQFNVAKRNTPGRNTNPQARLHDGVICPACHEVVEIKCWKSTSEDKPFSNYLRHFKERHRKDKKSANYFDMTDQPPGNISI